MQTSQFLDGWAPNAVVLSSALLVARIVFGLIMSAHGAQKLFGWFGGYGLTATTVEPFCANNNAVARPIPLLAPVTITTFPCIFK